MLAGNEGILATNGGRFTFVGLPKRPAPTMAAKPLPPPKDAPHGGPVLAKPQGNTMTSTGGGGGGIQRPVPVKFAAPPVPPFLAAQASVAPGTPQSAVNRGSLASHAGTGAEMPEKEEAARLLRMATVRILESQLTSVTSAQLAEMISTDVDISRAILRQLELQGIVSSAPGGRGGKRTAVCRITCAACLPLSRVSLACSIHRSCDCSR